MRRDSLASHPVQCSLSASPNRNPQSPVARSPHLHHRQPQASPDARQRAGHWLVGDPRWRSDQARRLIARADGGRRAASSTSTSSHRSQLRGTVAKPASCVVCGVFCMAASLRGCVVERLDGGSGCWCRCRPAALGQHLHAASSCDQILLASTGAEYS